MTPHTFPTGNLILDALPALEREGLLAVARPVTLALGDILYEQGDEVLDVHFLTSGGASVLVSLVDGRALESAIVGSEGILGFPFGLGQNRSRWRSVVQIPGAGYAVGVGDLAAILRQPGELAPLLTHYAGLLVTFVAQSAACTRFHEIRERAARWLLIMQDRSDSPTFTITHDWLAYMLGASRPALSHALARLGEEGVIDQYRGSIRILDRAQLEAASCECYAHVQEAFAEWVSAPSARGVLGGYQPSE